MKPVWKDSADRCALHDGERHLGHALKIGERWIAYDATKLNTARNGFLFLGYFSKCADAKAAVEESALTTGMRYFTASDAPLV